MRSLWLTSILIAFCSVIFAQIEKDTELFLTLKSLDSLLFEEGFNKCDISVFEKYIPEDLEFYHDSGGLTNSKAAFIEGAKNNICGNPDAKPIRKLVPNSLEVFPLYQNGKLYAAIQNGEHEFFIAEPKKELYQTSWARFTHLWVLEDDIWYLKRVLSFDHKSPEQLQKER